MHTMRKKHTATTASAIAERVLSLLMRLFSMGPTSLRESGLLVRRDRAALRRDAGLVLLERHLHFAGLAALVDTDHALGPHEVEQARCARVADGQSALQERRAAALLREHDAHGLVVELVLLRGVE